MASRSPSPRRSKERSSRRSPSPRDNDRYNYKQRSNYVNNRPNYHRHNNWQPRGGYNNYYQRNRWQGNYRGRGYNRPYNNHYHNNRGHFNNHHRYNNYNNYNNHQNHGGRYRRSRSRGSRSRSRSRSYSRSRSRERSYSRSRSRSYSSRSRSRSHSQKSNRSRSASPAVTSKQPGLEALAYFRGNSYSGDSDAGKDGDKTSPDKDVVQSKTDHDNTSNKLEESALAAVERHRNNLSEMIKQQASSSFATGKESGEKAMPKFKQLKTFSINSSTLTNKTTTLYSSSDEDPADKATKGNSSSNRRGLEKDNQVIEIQDDDDQQLHTSDKNSSATGVEPKSQAKEDNSASASNKLLSQLGGLKVVGPDGKPMNLIAVTVPDGEGNMMQVLQIPSTATDQQPTHGTSGEKVASTSDRMEVDNTEDKQKDMGEKQRHKQWSSNTVVTYPGNYMGEGGGVTGADNQGFNYTSNTLDFNEPGSTQFGFQTTKKAVANKTQSRDDDDDFTDAKYEAAMPASQKVLTETKKSGGESDEKKTQNKSALVTRKEMSFDEDDDNEDYLDLGKGKKKKKKSKDKKKKKKKKSKKSSGNDGDEEKLSAYEEFKLKHEQAGRKEDDLKRDVPVTLPITHVRGILVRRNDEGKVSLFNHIPSLDKKKQKEAAAAAKTVEEQFVSLFADETDQKEEELEPAPGKLDMSLRALRRFKLNLPTPRKVNHRTDITINNRLENLKVESQKKKKKSSKQQIVQQVSVNLDGLSKTAAAKKRKKSKTRSLSPAEEVEVKIDSSGKRGYRERNVRSSSSSQSPSPPPRSKRARSRSRSLPQAYKRSDGGNDKDGSDYDRRDGSSSSRSHSRDRDHGNNRMSYNNHHQQYQSRNFYNNNRYQRGRGNYNNFNNFRGNFRGRYNNNNWRGGYNNNRGYYNNNRGYYNNNNRGSYFHQYYNNNRNYQNDYRSRRDDRDYEHDRHRNRDDRSRSNSQRDRYSSVESDRSSTHKSKDKKETPIIILSSPEHSSKDQAVDASVRLKKMNEPWTHDMYEEQEAETRKD